MSKMCGDTARFNRIRMRRIRRRVQTRALRAEMDARTSASTQPSGRPVRGKAA